MDGKSAVLQLHERAARRLLALQFDLCGWFGRGFTGTGWTKEEYAERARAALRQDPSQDIPLPANGTTVDWYHPAWWRVRLEPAEDGPPWVSGMLPEGE
jgi:hypothetical protein